MCIVATDSGIAWAGEFIVWEAWCRHGRSRRRDAVGTPPGQDEPGSIWD